MRPDLLLVMTDQQRGDQLGRLDGSFETPVLDRLAAVGVAFDAATSASTVCVPARNALLTGLQAHRLPAQDNGIALAEGHWTFARALRDAGYQTALVGKMHQSPVHADHGFEQMRMCEHPSALSFGPIAHERGDTTDDYHGWLDEQGWPDWRLTPDQRREWTLPPEAHPTAWVEREAIDVLDRRDPARPLLLVVSFPHPHAPYNPPEPYASQYPPGTSVLPDEGYEVNLGLPLEFQVATEAGVRSTGEVRAPGLAAFLGLVRGLVRQIDDSVGRILERVDLGRTTVAFTSDHGDWAGHRGLQRKAPWIPFEDLARVPLIVAGGGVDATGSTVTTPVQACDLAQTFLELADLPAPDLPFSGRSLGPHLRGEAGAADLDRTVWCGTSLAFASVRRGPHKLIRHAKGAEVLYDLAADPGERTDLAAAPEHAAVLDDLRGRLLAELSAPVGSAGSAGSSAGA